MLEAGGWGESGSKLLFSFSNGQHYFDKSRSNLPSVSDNPSNKDNADSTLPTGIIAIKQNKAIKRRA